MANAFSEQTPINEEVKTPQQVQVETRPIFNELVGEGKKYNSEESLAKSRVEADTFIIQLQKETKELREELDKRLSAEAALEKIQVESKISDEQTTQVSEDKVTDLVKQTMLEMTADETAKANINSVDALLEKKYGDKRGGIVAAKAKELGVDLKFLEATAGKSPSAFLGMIGEAVKQEATTITAPTGSVNTEALSAITKTNNTDTYSYFEELRRSDPRTYFKPETQNKMLRLADEKGQAFYT